MEQGASPVNVSKQALVRLPSYLRYLKELRAEGAIKVSAPMVARHFGWHEVQVRKDFSAVSREGGKPRSGFLVAELIASIERFLGYWNTNDAVIVGVGALGSALLSYEGFEECGVRMVAAFDVNPKLIDTDIGGKPVFSMDRLPELCRRLCVHIGIITVPAPEAQRVCDLLVEGGILAIWNFAPVRLSVPGGVLLRDENMAVSLAILSKHLRENLAHEEEKA